VRWTVGIEKIRRSKGKGVGGLRSVRFYTPPNRGNFGGNFPMGEMHCKPKQQKDPGFCGFTFYSPEILDFIVS
jgi:hypothetical protein